MDISISKAPRSIDRRTMAKAAQFYARTLMSDRLTKNIKIDIEFTDLTNHGCTAMVNWEDCNWRPRWFTIYIDRDLKQRTALTNLAHEMVHVKQHATGESRDNLRDSHLPKWQGRVYNVDKVDYFDLPWEVEAFGRERALYVRFKEECTREKKNYKAAKSSRARPSRSKISKADRQEQKTL